MRNENAFYGALALNAMRCLHATKGFVFPGAVSLKYGICDFNQELLQMQQQILESSDEIYVLADSSKFARKAGLILCGKTNASEFGLTMTTEPTRFGATLNPWDHSKSPGGSSGGSAAAVAGVVAVTVRPVRIPVCRHGCIPAT